MKGRNSGTCVINATEWEDAGFRCTIRHTPRELGGVRLRSPHLSWAEMASITQRPRLRQLLWGYLANVPRKKRNAQPTLLVVVLDRSGSMASVREATVSGFNQLLAEQLALPGEVRLSLTQFDDRYEPNYVAEPLENLPPMDALSYIPRGRTALQDAIGRAIGDTQTYVESHGWTGQVCVAIITDGQENASLEYAGTSGLAAIAELVRVREAAGWTFVFMGANMDSWAVAGGYGITNAANWEHSSSGARNSWTTHSAAVSAYRASGTYSQAPPTTVHSPQP